MCRVRFPTSALAALTSISLSLAACGPQEDAAFTVDDGDTPGEALVVADTSGSIQYTGNKQYCADIRSSATANGTAVQLWACNNSSAQTWTYSNGAIKGLGKCLDIPNGNAVNGAKLRLWDCNGSNAQKWSFSNGYIYSTVNNSKCVDLPNNSVTNGAQLQLWDCYANDAAQNWTFPGSSSGSGSGGSTDTLSDILPLASSNTTSSRTVMGTNFEGVLNVKPTTAQTSFFTDATQQPPIPGSTSGLHLHTFNVTLYPSGSPAPTDINQHAIGNCDGDSALASMAYVAPSFVKSLITDHGNGVYSVPVYAPNGSKFVIYVNNSFLADGSNNIAAVSGKNGVATWATVLEKVVMKYVAVYPIVSDVGGIGAELTTPIFTGVGSSYAFGRGVLSASQLTRAAKALLAQGKFIAGGFGQVMTVGNDESVTAHGYAVLVPNGSAMMSMRNPWGVSPTTSGGYDSSADGVLNIPSTSAWASTIDLRVIDPGAAGAAGTTVVYAPRAEHVSTDDVRINEPHAHKK